MKPLLLTMCLLICASCGLENRGVSHEKPAEQAGLKAVRVSVDLQRAYVRSHSSIQYALQSVTPFTNNVVCLYGINAGTQEAFAWRQLLEWGPNDFWVLIPENTQQELRLRIGGTREGLVEVGSIDAQQTNIQIHFTEAGAFIKPGL